MTHPAALIAGVDVAYVLSLVFAGIRIRVETNDADVWAGLNLYYEPYVKPLEETAPDVVVTLVQGKMPVSATFRDVVRRDGKRVKEAVDDVPGGRLILKRSTGVVMGLWPGHGFAAGAVRANLNQAINLINACYAKAVLQDGYALFHASAVSRDGCAIVLAGVPGAGKSSAALHLVEAGWRFVSNDRVLARAEADGVAVLGYPKQPRVNPGTLMGHPRLGALLKAEERERLAALPPAELWQLEHKRDVDLDLIYGKGTVTLAARMAALALLRWSPAGGPVAIRRIDATEALAERAVFAKTLGAFDLDRSPDAGPTAADLRRYAEVLARVRIVEVSGGVDFGALTRLAPTLLD